jgi:hypothetical protein
MHYTEGYACKRLMTHERYGCIGKTELPTCSRERRLNKSENHKAAIFVHSTRSAKTIQYRSPQNHKQDPGLFALCSPYIVLDSLSSNGCTVQSHDFSGLWAQIFSRLCCLVHDLYAMCRSCTTSIPSSWTGAFSAMKCAQMDPLGRQIQECSGL